MSEFTRRDFLTATASAVAGASLSAKAIGAPAPTSALNQIEHFIILMQENRSFDHYFGTLRGVRGFDDPNAMQLESGRSVFYQPDRNNRDGYTLPFRLNTTTTSAQQLHDLSHAWATQHDVLNGGKMDRWLPAHRQTNGSSGPLTMGYYTREDLPYYYALADAFTICDDYHCSVLGPTYPNRVYFMSASVDADGRNGGPVTNNIAGRTGGYYGWETYAEALQRAGVSWMAYFDGHDEFGLNVLPYFSNFRYAKRGSALSKNALTGHTFAEFLTAVTNGTLPQVTWVIPHGAECEHPSYLPAAGENYVNSILQALWANPAVWAKTAFLLMYDENDGLFDHVAPPQPPPGTTGEFVRGKSVGLGFRVPCMVISPYSRGGYVSSDTFDHTSVLRMLETRFGVEVPNLTAWRRATCNDLTTAFSFDRPADLSVPLLPETVQALERAKENVKRLPPPAPPAVQSMPTQEPGTRLRV